MIKRKDGAAFNFYGVKLTYTNYKDPTYYTYPFLTVQYGTTGAAQADEKYDSDRTVTVSKPSGVAVTSVTLGFHGLNTLILDDLIVGPAAGSNPTPAPAITQNPSSTAACIGNNAVFTASATNATSFSWQESSTADFAATTTLTSGGIYNISSLGNNTTLTITTNSSVNGKYYRAVASGSSGSANTTGAQLTVNALPTPSITGLNSAYCKNASAVTLTGSPSGGSFTIDGSGATSFNPATLSVGSHSVVYAYPDGNGCSNTAPQSVTVKEVPTPPTMGTQSGHAYPAGSANLTISQNTGDVILTVSGCAGGTISWAGGNATTLAVATNSVGSFTFGATCTRNGCTSPVASATVQVANTTLSVSHRDAGYGNLTDDLIAPFLQLNNDGGTPIPYNQITVRYWFTSEGAALPTDLAVYYAQIGGNNVKMKYVPLAQPYQGANGYVEYSFDAAAGSLGATSNSGPIENAIRKSDHSAFNEGDDYSYASPTNYTPNGHITAYVNGTIFWGQEPAPVPVVQAVKVYSQNTSSVNSGNLVINLELRNLGNVPLSLADLKIRYWFTAESSLVPNVYIDYAQLGSSNIQRQVVRLSNPVAGADTYLELGFAPGLGSLASPGSTGEIHFRLEKPDYSAFNQADDYSYLPIQNYLSENAHMGV